MAAAAMGSGENLENKYFHSLCSARSIDGDDPFLCDSSSVNMTMGGRARQLTIFSSFLSM